MVHEQGDIVDSIESNIEATTVQVTTGTEQLRQAADYQSKARKKKMPDELKESALATQRWLARE